MAPQTSGMAAAASSARCTSPPVRAASAPQRSTTPAAISSVQPAKTSLKVSSPVPRSPGSAITGAASGGYSKKTSRYGSCPSSTGAAKVRYT